MPEKFLAEIVAAGNPFVDMDGPGKLLSLYWQIFLEKQVKVQKESLSRDNLCLVAPYSPNTEFSSARKCMVFPRSLDKISAYRVMLSVAKGLLVVGDASLRLA